MITEMTPYIEKMAAISDSRNEINADMYSKHKVFCGLRNLNGKGVVTVLTEVSNIKAKEIDSFGNEILDVKNSGQPHTRLTASVISVSRSQTFPRSLP